MTWQTGLALTLHVILAGCIITVPVAAAVAVSAARGRHPCPLPTFRAVVSVVVILVAAVAGLLILSETKLPAEVATTASEVGRAEPLRLLGDGLARRPVLAAVLLLVVLALVAAGRSRGAACVLIGPIAAVQVTERVWKPLLGGGAYPSGHATAGVALLFAIALAAWPSRRSRLWALLYVASVLILSLAVVTEVSEDRGHTFGEAVGGAFAGVSAVAVVALVLSGASALATGTRDRGSTGERRIARPKASAPDPNGQPL